MHTTRKQCFKRTNIVQNAKPRPWRPRQNRSKIKVMLTVRFDNRGALHYELLPRAQTVTEEY